MKVRTAECTFLTIVCQTVQVNNEISQIEYHLLTPNHSFLFLGGDEALINIFIATEVKAKFIISTIHKGPISVIVSGWGAVLDASFVCAC